ncbi:hypothetical protein KAT24_01120 [Candidatus Pacearchaeota archaeon]|nr:hypothetical protein [Candidatus Pacearchaeota archaeon]
MAEEINEEKLRKELLKIYESFINNPEDKKVLSLAQEYHLRYSGLQTCNEHLVKSVISENTEKAINELSTIYQYGMHDENHPAFSNKKIIESAKKILEELKK